MAGPYSSDNGGFGIIYSLCVRGKASFPRTKGFTMEGIMKYLDFRDVPPEIRSLFKTPEA